MDLLPSRTTHQTPASSMSSNQPAKENSRSNTHTVPGSTYLNASQREERQARLRLHPSSFKVASE